MLLTEDDKKRIGEAGHTGYYDEESSQLVNVNGRCYFLTEEGLCTIYDIRPIGCRLYPLIMALPSRRAIIDDECPHHKEFSIEQGDISVLEGLIETLEREGRA